MTRQATKAAAEQAAIRAARSYARENGRPEDRVVIGLILAGMVIGSRLDKAAREAIASGYADQHPDADYALTAWADTINVAALSTLD